MSVCVCVCMHVLMHACMHAHMFVLQGVVVRTYSNLRYNASSARDTASSYEAHASLLF